MVAVASCNPKEGPAKPEEPEVVPDTPDNPDNPDNPDGPDTPEPPVFGHMLAKWELTSSIVSSGLGTWQSSNRFYATHGEGREHAWISSFTGNSGGTTPSRISNGNRLSVSNLAEGDGIEFDWEGLTLSEGTAVDFMTMLMTPNGNAPKYWLFEYEDGGQWCTVEEDLHTASEDASLKYSCYVKYFSSYEYTSFTQSFTLSHPLENGVLKMRLRAVGPYNNAGGSLSASANSILSFINYSFQTARIDVWQNSPLKDTKKMLVIGNSFTYSNGGDFLLLEIARSQGHGLRMREHLKGGQTFAQHLTRERTLAAIREGGYDYAIIQDQSNQHAAYYSDVETNSGVLTGTRSIVDEIEKYSPSVNTMLEATWAFKGQENFNGFGSYELFDKALWGGALLIGDACDIWLSPIGIAYERARKAGISLYRPDDNKHPALNGAYLKACVNYLMIYGEPFDANVPDLDVDAATAASLRKIAEEVVLPDIQSYRNPDASQVVPGEGLDNGEIDPGQVVAGENGIRTREQLLSFAKVVNAGGDISSYCNANGEVVLLEDIELDDAEWTPIGTASGVCYAANPPTPLHTFKGVFDGQGHSISGLRLVVDDNTYTVMGFFGATSGTTVRNIVFDGATMTLNSTGVSASHLSAGIVAGYALDSKFENVSVTASISGKVTTTGAKSVAVGGIIGTAASLTDNATTVSGCSFAGSITNDISTKYATGNSAVVGGIVAQVPNMSVCKTVLVKGCVNNATIDVKAHRAAGVVCGGTHSHIENCINNGDITVSQSASKPSGAAAGCRVGGVMAYCTENTANDYYIKDCENNGTINVPESSSYVGGVAGLLRTYAVSGCKNRGNVYSISASRGLLVGCLTSANPEPTFANCALRGRIGKNADNAVEATAENYLQLGISYNGGSASTWNAANISFLTE